MALSVSNNHRNLIMLLVDHDNDRTVIECNDTSKINIISFGDNSLNVIESVYIVTDLTSAVEAVKHYYE